MMTSAENIAWKYYFLCTEYHMAYRNLHTLQYLSHRCAAIFGKQVHYHGRIIETTQCSSQPKVAIFPSLQGRHSKGGLGNVICEVVWVIRYEVNSFAIEESTFLAWTMKKKLYFGHFYPFWQRFDDVTRRHCNVVFSTSFMKQKMMWPIQIYILFIGSNTF